MKARFAAIYSTLSRDRLPKSRLLGRRNRRVIVGLLLLLILLARSSVPQGDPLEHIRFYTRNIEFDFINWTLGALGVKLDQAILGTVGLIPDTAEPDIVLSYLQLLGEINGVEAQISTIYTDPAVKDAYRASESLRIRLNQLKQERQYVEPVAEAILQNQLGTIAAEMGLTLGGQTLPPALFHTTPPPYALIVSPRDIIRQDFSISISPDLSLDQMVTLENQVDRAMDVSSLVVGIGGIGLYPTMVMETTDINWLAEVISHEWIHNYLTLRPLGILYMKNPALRTMNETAASIAGKEMGRQLVAKYYPAYLPPPEVSQPETKQSIEPKVPTVFDFRAEMRKTRVRVDELLQQGKINEAESYMEQRRQVFWDQGYHIRKINQAYFAFYGAYADAPGGGAAGADPVGAAVRLLRQQSQTLREFIHRISWMSSYEQLERIIETDQVDK